MYRMKRAQAIPVFLAASCILLSPCLTRAMGVTGAGLRLGLNLAQTRLDPGVGGEAKLGLCGGLHMVYSLNDVLGIQPEILYTTKGTQWTFREDGPPYNPSGSTSTCQRMYLDYIEMPVLLRFSISIDDRIHPNLLIGPYWAFLVRYRWVSETPEEVIVDELENLKSRDHGTVVGGGIDFSAGRGAWTIGARYAFGWTGICTETDRYEYDSAKQSRVTNPRNSVVSLMVGYTW